MKNGQIIANAVEMLRPPKATDMLGAMMTGVDRATGEQLDDVNIRYQINTFLIAGHETTSGLLSCTIYALLKHPEVLKKAYEEVDRVLGPDINARPTYQQVTQLTYITQILKEALRLWPPAPAYGIAPLQDETIGGKYKLKKNTFVTVLVMALHRDPSVWGPNPDAFDPENFSREAEAKRPVNAWKPFGNGQRACIGRGFAMHEAALAIGMILQRFKLIDTHRYQMHLKETLTIKPDGFKIKVRPRADKDRGAFAGRAAAAAPLRTRRRRRRGPVPDTTRRYWCSTAPTSARRKSWRRGWPTSPRSTALRPSSARSTITSASFRKRAGC